MILLVLAGGFGGYYWYWQSHAVDRKVQELVYEAAGYPDSSMEKRLKEWKLDFLLREKPKPREEDVVRNELQAIGNPATPELVSLLNNENDKIRFFAVDFLGSVGDARAVDPLIQVLEKDNEAGIRFYAVISLGNLGDKRAVEPLIRALQKDKGVWSRGAEAGSLVKLGDPRAISALEEAMQKDDDPEIQEMFKAAIMMLKSAATRPGVVGTKPAGGI
ncbi:MAG: HEAT repeat domain-containing protein [Planctomycetes bacterium]|nr:HEAT repeat domain-containing protein [Planctomycetota bacterium]